MSEIATAPDLFSKRAIARIYRGNKVIGAGFLVEGGHVLTCAHVVRDALALKSEDAAEGKTLELNFPYLSLKQKLTAEVVLYRLTRGDEEQNEDIAGLRIVEFLPKELLPARLLVSYQLHNPYWVLGFPNGHPKGISSSGQLLQDLPNGWVQLEDTKAQGLAILPGFSGTPVWDERSSEVVGMVVAREKDQPEAKIGFMVPARFLMTVKRELMGRSLLPLLKEHEKTLDDAIKVAYRLACPLKSRMPTGLPELLSNLQEAKQGDNLFTATDRFVAFLNLPDLNPNSVLRGRLKEWLSTRTIDLQALIADVQRCFTEELKSSSDSASHLLVHVKDEVGDTRFVSALFIRDGSQYDVQFGKGSELLQAPGQAPFSETVTLEMMPSLVQACLKEALEKSPTNLTLHLILPLSWLNQACDRWSAIDCSKLAFMPNIPVGVRFCCVVRITERLNPEVLQMFKEPWQRKWQKLLSHSGNDVCTVFIPADNLSLENELFARLNQSTSLGLKLAKVYEEGHYSKLFGVLIATGTPAAVWLRHDHFSEEVCAITDLDKLLTCNIATLPEKVKQFRSNAMAVAENGHIGHHLSFLWEDPTLIPPSTQASLGMPQP